jgi:DNA-binding response OmpR family regulator
VGEAKPKILIVEDDIDLSTMLDTYLRIQGYEVFCETLGEEGVRTCERLRPGIVVLDIHLPDIDGYEVARRMRSQQRTMAIPIIFLTEKRDRVDRLFGLELGADDYITKPFDIQELRLRIRNALRRAKQDSLTNPVTGLPEGALVDERLNQHLNCTGWSLLIIKLENLDLFRETYGFVASDDALRAVSLMMQNITHELGGKDDFLGHLGQLDFVISTDPAHVHSLQDGIRTRLEQSLDYFYPIKDRDKRVRQTSRMLVKIGLLQGGDGNFTSLEDLKLSLLRKRG